MRVMTTLLSAGVLVTYSRAADELCHWQGSEDALRGQEGSSAANQYWFTHVSDVTKARMVIFDIDNNHPNNFLPAEWIKGDGKVQVRFQYIAPNGCGANEFPVDKDQSLTKDLKAYIQYGPILQNTQANAPLYIVSKQPSSNTKADFTSGSSLRSRIVADLQGPASRKEHLELEFTTKAEGNQYTYTVTNLGDHPAFFNIAELSNMFDQLASARNLSTESKWIREGEWFYVKADKTPESYVIHVEKEEGFEVIQNLVEFKLPFSDATGQAQITVYVPRAQ
jgi:hypothetical protein